MKTKPPIGRVLEPEPKWVVEFSFRRSFTWKERLKIFLGYTADISIAMATQHNCGKFTPKMILEVTPALRLKPKPQPIPETKTP